VSSTKCFDPAKYPDGSAVRIVSRAALEEFSRIWTMHHPLHSEQLDHASRTAIVRASFMYHGGDVLYQLEGIPGIWHDQCLTAGNDAAA
jgi:hypothetical protein